MKKMNNVISSLSFKNVNFAYEESKNIFAESISVEFQIGSINVVTGENGCGKSTLLNLPLGIWNNYSGFIYMDKEDMKAFDKEHLRNLVSYAFQMPAIVKDTILSNIAWGKTIEIERIVRLVEAINFRDDIESKPQSFHTIIDREALSQGQLQKMEIARVLYTDSPIMIFDEPTSNLDVKSVHALIRLLKEIKHQHLIIIISHDDRIIQEADYKLRL